MLGGNGQPCIRPDTRVTKVLCRWIYVAYLDPRVSTHLGMQSGSVIAWMRVLTHRSAWVLRQSHQLHETIMRATFICVIVAGVRS